MVIWLIGLSGAGKTTIGKELWRRWKTSAPNTVLVDGDEMRRIFGHNTSADAHTMAGRRRNAERIVEICRWLDGQGINVVCCILSLFPDMREANRQLYSGYFEVYLRADLNTLAARDTKQLYRPAMEGRLPNVVGVDIPFPEPEHPDLVMETGPGAPPAAELAQTLLTTALAGRGG